MTTTTQDKLGAYGSTHREHRSPREIELHALLSCAARLKAALDDGGKDMKEYSEAIKHNQKLWTMFQVGVCDPDNPLPSDLKSKILTLSNYIDRTSFSAVTTFAPEQIKSLIDINRIVAIGLSKTPNDAAQTSPQKMSPPPISANTAPSVRTSA